MEKHELSCECAVGERVDRITHTDILRTLIRIQYYFGSISTMQCLFAHHFNYNMF